MTKMKKVVAVVLAFLMIFSSVSVMAFADFDVATSDGYTLTVNAEIGKTVSGAWQSVDKVLRGDEVTVRISMGTDYYSNSSQLLFFYDKSFFNTNGVSNVLTVNNTVFSADSYAYTSADASAAAGLVAKGLVTADYLASHGFVIVNLQAAAGTANFKYDTAAWQFAITLKVNDDAAGTGNFFILDSTVQSTSNPKGIVNVPKGPQGGYVSDNYNMYFWNASFSGCTDSVTVNTTTTLNPNGGTWTADSSTEPLVLSGITGAELTVPALTNGDKTLHGWYPSDTENPTREDCVDLTSFDEFDDVAYTAFWIDKINVTFDLNGGNIDGSTDAIVASVTPGYDWEDSINPAEPTREGYDFRGWSADPNASAQAEDTNVFPSVYPAADTTYYAIWAKKVTLTFKDTFDNTTVGTVTGYAGDAVEASAPTMPTHTGYYAVTGDYIPVLPAVFPADDAVYNAYFEPIENIVTFKIMNGSNVYQTIYRGISYGSKIVAKDSKVAVAPEGMKIVGWYTDAACQNEFDYDTVMLDNGFTLYAYLDEADYTVTFDANGGAWADESTEKTQDVAYLDTITVPAENPTRAGYVFDGWEPLPGVLDTAADTTFKASWQLKEYAVKYVVDGEDYETYYAYIDEEFDVPDDPYKAGAYFIGWDLCSDPTDYTSGDGETDAFPETVTGDFTYVALFAVKATYVIYKAADSTEEFARMDRNIPQGEIILAEGSTLVKLPEGMELSDWYTDANWTDSAKFDHGTVMASAPVVLYAYLKSTLYTVTFDANGGAWADGDTEKSTQAAYLGTIEVPATDPTQAGYTFLGWEPAAGVLTEANDVTYYASWLRNTYKVSYYLDEDKTLYEEYGGFFMGDEIDVPAEPDMMGYDFIGWDIDGDGEADDMYTEVMPDGDLEVYALWDVMDDPVAVVWDANGGKFTDEATSKKDENEYFFDDDVTAITDVPVREGYDFLGWASAADAEEAEDALKVDDYKIVSEAGAPVKTKTFYAVYAVQTVVTVNFYVPTRNTTDAVGQGYGTLTANISDYTLLESNEECIPGDSVPAVTGDPTIQYYKFLGWSTDGTAANIIDETATIPSGGANYYAVYEREAVYLISKDATKSSIDRRGNAIGSWNTLFTETTFDISKYANSSSCNLWFVHVVPGSIRNATKYTSEFFDVAGDGTITVTKGAGGWGTGSTVTVTDNVTGEVAEKFYVVIYGDVDGNGTINSTDSNNVYDAFKKLKNTTWSTKGTYDFCKMYAANLNTPARVTTINSADQLAVLNVVKGVQVLDALTGVVTYPTT